MARDELIRRATRQEEARALGGDDDGPGPYDVLEAALTAALERVRELRAHAHRWEVDEDTKPVSVLDLWGGRRRLIAWWRAPDGPGEASPARFRV